MVFKFRDVLQGRLRTRLAGFFGALDCAVVTRARVAVVTFAHGTSIIEGNTFSTTTHHRTRVLCGGAHGTIFVQFFLEVTVARPVTIRKTSDHATRKETGFFTRVTRNGVVLPNTLLGSIRYRLFSFQTFRG